MGVRQIDNENPIVTITIDVPPEQLTVYDLKQLIFREVLNDNFIPERQKLFYNNI